MGLTPTLSIVNAGVDTNVFNEAVNPQQDVTATFTPAVQVWLRAGSTRLRGASTLSAVYFREFENQRSFNRINDIRWEVPLNRVLAFTYFSAAHMRSRPNDEIDIRVKNSNSTAGVGTAIRLGYRTSVVVEARRRRTNFGESEEFLGANLSDSLDRTSNNFTTSFRMDVTPLTTIVLSADVEEDKFDHSPLRDSFMKGFSPGIEFGRGALITGSASLGIRQFDMRAPLVPDYSGLTAAVDLSYVLKERTRFSTRYDRDLVYSFSEIRPYYVEGRVTASVAQQLTTQWEVSFAATLHRQDYDVSSRIPTGELLTLAPEVAKLNSYQTALM
jgi:hypothetical protein